MTVPKGKLSGVTIGSPSLKAWWPFSFSYRR